MKGMPMLKLLKMIDTWLTPSCDLCGKKETKDDMLFTDGIQLQAHAKCWDDSYQK